MVARQKHVPVREFAERDRETERERETERQSEREREVERREAN
jgi:hypothetical protein